VKLGADASHLKAGDAVTVGIRPHDIAIGEGAATAVEAQVTLVEALGPETVAHAQTREGQKMVAVLDGQQLNATGGTVKMRFDPARAHLFDPDGARVG
jgi:ABC-type sugar transport system ATPase subunit